MKGLGRTFLFLWMAFVCPGCFDQPRKPQPETVDTTLVINNKQVLKPEDRKNAYADVDISPMDMSYYPPNYPQLKMSDPSVEPPLMRVIYSRPHLQGRQLFPDILKLGEPWRLGANEATEIHVFKTVKAGKQSLRPGRYTMHCIPQENEWEIVFNSAVDIWGLKFDKSKDLFSTNIPVTREDVSVEYLTMVFEKSEGGANLVIRWANVVARLPFQF